MEPGARRRRHGSGHGQGSDRRRDAGGEVEISNPVTGFRRTTTTDASGKFVFSNLPPNPYHISVAAQGFEP